MEESDVFKIKDNDDGAFCTCILCKRHQKMPELNICETLISHNNNFEILLVLFPTENSGMNLLKYV